MGGVTPEHLRNFFGIEAGEASGQVFTAFSASIRNRIAGGKIAMYFERAGHQQRGTPAASRLAGAASTTIVPRGSAAKPMQTA